jgi:hypothetical protein
MGSNHHTDKAILVALVLIVMVAAIFNGEQKLYDGFLIGLGIAMNHIGQSLKSE